MEDITGRDDHKNVHKHLKRPILENSASNDLATQLENIYEGSHQDLKSMYTSLLKDEFKMKYILTWVVNVHDYDTNLSELIKLLSELTLTVTVHIIFSEENELNLWSKTDNGFSKYDKGNNSREISEIGRVFDVSKYEGSSEMDRCPCKKCQHSEKPSKDWGKVMILMARSEDYKDIGTTTTSCDFFGEIQSNGRPVTFNNVVLRKSNVVSDWQELECVTCDLELLASLQKIIKRCSTLLKQLHDKVNKTKENEGYEKYPLLKNNRGASNSEIDIEENNCEDHNDVSFQSHAMLGNFSSFEMLSIFFSSVSLLVAIAALVVVCVGINNTEDLSTNVSFAKENVCLSCTNSSLSGKMDEILKYLEELTRSTQSPQQNAVPPVHTISHTPSSAHLYLREPPKIAGTDGDDGPNFSNKDHVDAHLQIPSGHSSAAQHFRGVHVSDTGIYISYSGLYYIYSSVSFKTNPSKSSSEFAYQNWFHYVHRISPNSPMNSGVLLRNVYTACPSCNNIAESGFTGGIFNLQAGDKIQVCFSGQGFIDYESNTSFLGLFMLSSPHTPQDHHLDVGV